MGCNHEWTDLNIHTKGGYGIVYFTGGIFEYCKKCGIIRVKLEDIEKLGD